MYDDAARLLTALGVEVTDGNVLLTLLCEVVTERLCNQTNQSELPDGLHWMAVEMVVGEYLQRLLSMGLLSVESIDLSAAASAIKEGDTSVTYALGSGSDTPETRLKALISMLTRDRADEVRRYRRLVW